MAKLKPRRPLALQESEEVLNLAQRLLEPVKKYWIYILIMGLITAAVALGAGINAYLQARKESQASAALAQVNLKPQDAAQETQTLQGLEKVIREYSSAGAAREAELLRANLLYRQKNFAEAAKAYESLSLPDPGLAPFIAESLSYCYEALGDFKKAAAVLQPAADQVKGPYQGEVWRRLAFLYEKAGEPREAAPYWKKLLERPNQAPGVVPYLKEKVAATEK
ncbi:MAG: tetratricopeptide repeat protein [Deltaproteobacteria bacterium]|nr:tetratricopeptide repeat protein [Deltaproteobacteria bacterium]